MYSLFTMSYRSQLQGIDILPTAFAEPVENTIAIRRSCMVMLTPVSLSLRGVYSASGVSARRKAFSPPPKKAVISSAVSTVP